MARNRSKAKLKHDRYRWMFYHLRDMEPFMQLWAEEILKPSPLFELLRREASGVKAK